jgi:hypothetical protein
VKIVALPPLRGMSSPAGHVRDGDIRPLPLYRPRDVLIDGSQALPPCLTCTRLHFFGEIANRCYREDAALEDPRHPGRRGSADVTIRGSNVRFWKSSLFSLLRGDHGGKPIAFSLGSLVPLSYSGNLRADRKSRCCSMIPQLTSRCDREIPHLPR